LDDLDRHSLKTAVQQSLTAFGKKDGANSLALGSAQVSVTRIRESLLAFLTLLETEEDLQTPLAHNFDVYQVAPSVLFTGYHEPVLNGSRVRTERYRYPLYRKPDDWAVNGKPASYFSRAEIDGKGALNGKGYELVWLDDPVDRFFLHVQGSGQIWLPNGTRLRVGYAADNGKPYQSIGKLLIDQGKLRSGETSTLAIRRYLEAHPDEQNTIFFYNPRYIFFRLSLQSPHGSLGVPLTAGRSLAVDPRIYPLGALALIRTKRPIVDQQGQVTWREFSRFVLLQDTGAAITGPQRADLFWGSEAEAEAGYMAQQGELYVLVKKPGGAGLRPTPVTSTRRRGPSR
jgi:membrane-bound lytic murein transglycosylase A